MTKYVAYLRVSTNKQDYGLDSQQDIIDKWVKGRGELIETFHEKISGKVNKRPELEKAVALCKKKDATLLIAKLDRLSRNVQFLFELKNSGIGIACCDLPELNTLTLGMFATMAQHERELISERTKKGLEIAREKGVKIGVRKTPYKEFRTDKTREEFKQLMLGLALDRNKEAIKAAAHFKAKGLNLSQTANELNSLGFTAPRGGKIIPTQVARLLRYSD